MCRIKRRHRTTRSLFRRGPHHRRHPAQRVSRVTLSDSSNGRTVRLPFWLSFSGTVAHHTPRICTNIPRVERTAIFTCLRHELLHRERRHGSEAGTKNAVGSDCRGRGRRKRTMERRSRRCGIRLIMPSILHIHHFVALRQTFVWRHVTPVGSGTKLPAS